MYRCRELLFSFKQVIDTHWRQKANSFHRPGFTPQWSLFDVSVPSIYIVLHAPMDEWKVWDMLTRLMFLVKSANCLDLRLITFRLNLSKRAIFAAFFLCLSHKSTCKPFGNVPWDGSGHTYASFRKARECKNGKGGLWMINVYEIRESDTIF